MIAVGTSGFSFEDWVGPVFPRSLAPSQRLPYYERVLGFRALELNSSFYALLSAPAVRGMIARTSPRFRFAVKAHRALTHGPGDPNVLDRFRGTIDLFREHGKFAGTLAQFPPLLRPGPAAFRTLEGLAGALGRPLFVEFRRHEWGAPGLLERLRDLGLSCVVPDLPPVGPLPRLAPVVTVPPAYLRLHGRNPGWFDETTMDRYDYTYSNPELKELADVVHALEREAGEVLVFFNNCRRGSAARDARRLAEVLSAPLHEEAHHQEI